MAKKSKSALLPLLAAAVLAVLGALVFQKVKAGRAVKSGDTAPLDDKAKEWVEEVVATPRPPASDLH
jgi:hypothetical protein